MSFSLSTTSVAPKTSLKNCHTSRQIKLRNLDAILIVIRLFLLHTYIVMKNSLSQVSNTSTALCSTILHLKRLIFRNPHYVSYLYLCKFLVCYYLMFHR